jgi:hypothetical protein
MSADISRIRDNPLLDFAGVDLKQGGVLVDADFNELVAVVDRRLRAASSDILGRSTVSSTTPDAFKLSIVAGSLMIGKGRLYVDGLLAENHGATSTDLDKKLFDPIMAELTYADPIKYEVQPYFPSPPPLPMAGRHLVYLDVWEREVTHIERPDLVEAAVGVETSSRQQIVWQVRVLEAEAGRADCASPDDAISGWPAATLPSTGRLTTGTFEVPPEEDPCELPPSGGYRGLENQTYRVEIHDPGGPGQATFVWSRDNASVCSRVANMVSDSELELDSLGRDEVLRFNSGDWVEIIDDVREFSQRCGEIRRITVNEAARRIAIAPALPADMIPGVFPNSDFPRERNLRVKRWDQKHEIRQIGPGGTTTVFQDLDAPNSPGVIKVPAAGTLLLESGVTVTFASTGTGGFRAGDFWVFAARTADASVEVLVDAPPRGIHHHFARLGIWDVSTGSVTDCRTPWPPKGEGHDCICTECVTPQSHASGKFTIQAAVDRLRDSGGTVCLGVGQFQLKEPVSLNSARAVRIRGHGAATVLVTPGGAFSVSRSVALAIEDLAILSLGHASVISVSTVLGLSLQRLIIAVFGGNDAKGAAIALAGAIIGLTIRNNAILAPVAVQATDTASVLTPGTPAPLPQMLISAALHIEDNVLLCEKQSVSLIGRVIHLMATRITGNEILASRLGAITALGLCGPGASMHVSGNSLNVAGPGITAAVDGLWIEGNKLVSTSQRANQQPDGAGITLRTGLDPNGANQCQILSNQISGFAGAAIAIQSPTRELIVKLNIIENCGNGIVSEGDAKSANVSIENNHISDIGGAGDGRTGFVVGIGVLRSDVASVTGNTIRRVGLNAVRAPLRAGIAAASVQHLRVSGNDVSGVAPAADYIGLAAGMVTYAPFAQADITLNRVDREEQPSSQPNRSQWFALRVDQPLGDRLVSRIGEFAAVRVDARTLVFGSSRLYVVTAVMDTDVAGAALVRGTNVSILGNVFAARGATPVVEVEVSGDCLFNDNRCELRASNDSAVRIISGAAIVNANRVRGGKVSVELLGDVKRMSVLGNITTGGINPKLGAPWDALNVIG